MPMQLGQSFQPRANVGESGGDTNRAQNLQTAIKLLSLRLPTRAGGPSAIASPGLLSGQGGSGGGGEAGIQMLQRLLGLATQRPSGAPQIAQSSPRRPTPSASFGGRSPVATPRITAGFRNPSQGNAPMRFPRGFANYR